MKRRDQGASPRNEAPQDFGTCYAENDGTVSGVNYTTPALPGIFQTHCPHVVTWLRCRACHHGYFASGAPTPQPCPVCAGVLQPVALWDSAHEAAPPGMLRLVSNAGLPPLEEG
jgi:hypothetical protein